MEVFVEDRFNGAWALHGNTDTGCNFIVGDSGKYITYNYKNMVNGRNAMIY